MPRWKSKWVKGEGEDRTVEEYALDPLPMFTTTATVYKQFVIVKDDACTPLRYLYGKRLYNALKFVWTVKSSNSLTATKLFPSSYFPLLFIAFVVFESIVASEREFLKCSARVRNPAMPMYVCVRRLHRKFRHSFYCYRELYRESILITSTHRWRAPIIIKLICVRIDFPSHFLMLSSLCSIWLDFSAIGLW